MLAPLLQVKGMIRGTKALLGKGLLEIMQAVLERFLFASCGQMGVCLGHCPVGSCTVSGRG